MAPSIAAVAAGAAMVLGAILLLVVLRARASSLPLSALLALWGAATITSANTIGAPDVATASLYARLTLWYTIPLAFLLLLTGGLVISGAAPKGPMRAATISLGVVSAIALIVFAAAPSLYLRGVSPFADGWTFVSGPLLYPLSALLAGAEAGLAAFAARRAMDPAASAIERQRASWVGLAAGIMPLHAAGFFAGFITLEPVGLQVAFFWVRTIVTLAAGAVAAVALVVLVRALPRGGRLAAASLVTVVFLLGLADAVVRAGRARGIPYEGYETSLVLVRVVFAFLLSVAVLRFGLADAGARGRRLLVRTTAGIMGLAGALGITGAAYLVLGSSPISLAVAAVVGVATPVAFRSPLLALAGAVTARLLLPPDDPRAVAERARTYAAAVAAARGAGDEGERYLRALRDDLGISDKEHELLVHGVASRETEHYTTLGDLGSGSSGAVSLAQDADGRRVVVKSLRVANAASALREARALASVAHPRIVRFIEVDRRGDDLRLVLAYAEGGSARGVLDREGPLAPERAAALTRDLLEGLEALHAAGLVHCDVKPENLLLDAEGRGMLGDFGSAHFATGTANLTLRDASGTLSTMSPEAVRGARPAPTRDVYAAGATMYRLLTGEHHIDLDVSSAFEARERILLDPPRLPHPRVPAGLEPVLLRALAKREGARYQTAREMIEALDHAQKK